MVSPVSANVLPAADLLSRLPPESSAVNRKMFPRDSSEDSLSACDRPQIYGTRRRLSLTGEGGRGEIVGGLRPAVRFSKAISDACMN